MMRLLPEPKEGASSAPVGWVRSRFEQRRAGGRPAVVGGSALADRPLRKQACAHCPADQPAPEHLTDCGVRTPASPWWSAPTQGIVEGKVGLRG